MQNTELRVVVALSVFTTFCQLSYISSKCFRRQFKLYFNLLPNLLYTEHWNSFDYLINCSLIATRRSHIHVTSLIWRHQQVHRIDYATFVNHINVMEKQWAIVFCLLPGWWRQTSRNDVARHEVSCVYRCRVSIKLAFLGENIWIFSIGWVIKQLFHGCLAE